MTRERYIALWGRDEDLRGRQATRPRRAWSKVGKGGEDRIRLAEDGSIRGTFGGRPNVAQQVLWASGYFCAMQFDCELVLRENDHEDRVPHSFMREVGPGTFVRHGDRDWIVIDVQEGEKPVVFCRPPSET